MTLFCLHFIGFIGLHVSPLLLWIQSSYFPLLSLPLSPPALLSWRLLLFLQTWRRPSALLPPRQTTQRGPEGGEEAAGSSPPSTRFKTLFFNNITSRSPTFPSRILRAAFGDASGCARNGEPTCPTKVDFTPLLVGCESPWFKRSNSGSELKHVQPCEEQNTESLLGINNFFSAVPHREDGWREFCAVRSWEGEREASTDLQQLLSCCKKTSFPSKWVISLSVVQKIDFWFKMC